MTVSSTQAREIYSCNGVTTVNTVPFRILDETHLRIVKFTIATSAVVDLVLTTDYTVQNVGAANAQFTMNAAPSSLYKLIAIRNVPLSQATDYVANDAFPAESHETALDKLTMTMQQLKDISDRSASLPEFSPLALRVILPTPTDQHMMYWNGSTGALANTSFTITSFATDVSNTAANAAAASASAGAASGSASSASSSASTATTQAGISTAQAAISTAQAVISTAQAVIATAQAGLASGYASTATSQAGIATTQASNASVSAAAAVVSAAAALASESAAAASAAAASASAGTASTQAGIATTQASNALASAAAAAASAAEGLYRDVVSKVFADSPIVPTAGQEGTAFRVDTSGGNVVINLSALATYAQDMKFAFVKTTADANTVTINRGSTDTINGSAFVVLSTQYEMHVLVGDSASGTWLDCVQTTGIPDGSVTLAKLANLAQDQFIGRVTPSTGVPETATITAAARSVLDDTTVAAMLVTLGLTQGANIASAATINLDTATGDYVHITGTTTITAVTLSQGVERTIVFDGALTFTNGASLLLPSSANITTVAGDTAVLRGEAAGVVRCVSYVRKDGRSAGIPAPSTSGNVMTSNGTAWTSAAPAGSTLVLLGTATASASATLNFTSLITSAYDSYYIVISDLITGSAATIGLKGSSNNGSTWVSNFQSQKAAIYLGTTTVPTHTGVNNTTPIVLSANYAGTAWSGYGYIVYPQSANGGTIEFAISAGIGVGEFYKISAVDKTGGLNAIQFLPSAGTFTSGKIYLYGVKNT